MSQHCSPQRGCFSFAVPCCLTRPFPWWNRPGKTFTDFKFLSLNEIGSSAADKRDFLLLSHIAFAIHSRILRENGIEPLIPQSSCYSNGPSNIGKQLTASSISNQSIASPSQLPAPKVLPINIKEKHRNRKKNLIHSDLDKLQLEASSSTPNEQPTSNRSLSPVAGPSGFQQEAAADLPVRTPHPQFRLSHSKFILHFMSRSGPHETVNKLAEIQIRQTPSLALSASPYAKILKKMGRYISLTKNGLPRPKLFQEPDVS